MIEELYSDIYRMEIPLPNNPLKALNSYLVKGKERNLLIDTGFNRQECKEAMDKAIRDIGVTMENTDILVTHIHGDHSGLAGYLARPNTKVYSGDYCAQVLMGKESGIKGYYKDLVNQSGLARMGISPDDPSIHPGFKFASESIPEVTVLRDGDVIKVGNYNLQCIETSGHAPDHICLYEPQRKILFSGDHILNKITPNNTIWGAPWAIEYNYLDAYLKNLDKIAALEIKLVFPGHRNVFTDCKQRIEELKLHHYKRLENILDIIGNEKMNGAEVASKMKWDLSIKKWDEFPPNHKFFATGEALSHLTYLVLEGVLIKELHDGVVYYRKNLSSIN